MKFLIELYGVTIKCLLLNTVDTAPKYNWPIVFHSLDTEELDKLHLKMFSANSGPFSVGLKDLRIPANNLP